MKILRNTDVFDGKLFLKDFGFKTANKVFFFKLQLSFQNVCLKICNLSFFNKNYLLIKNSINKFNKIFDVAQWFQKAFMLEIILQ